MASYPEKGDLFVLPDLSAVRHYYRNGDIELNTTLNRLVPLHFIKYTIPMDSGKPIEFPSLSLNWIFADREDVIEAIPDKFRDFMLRCFVYDPKNEIRFNTSVSNLRSAGIIITRLGDGEVDPYLKLTTSRQPIIDFRDQQILKPKLPPVDLLKLFK